MKKTMLIAISALALVALATSAWLLLPGSRTLANAAMAEYSIERMTCGSCVGNIEQALAALDGVGDVDVNLTAQRGRVTYDPALIDTATIARVISDAGYPANLRLEMSPQDYAALQQEQTLLGEQYLARIGDRLISRQEFDALVARQVDGATAAESAALRNSVWQELLQRELLLAAAEQNQVLVPGGEVDVRLDELRQGHQGFDSLIEERFGGMESFRQRLHDDMVINRNIEDNVLVGVSDPRQRQQTLQAWYAGLQQQIDVVIFDQSLKSAGSGKGCGGSCCS